MMQRTIPLVALLLLLGCPKPGGSGPVDGGTSTTTSSGAGPTTTATATPTASATPTDRKARWVGEWRSGSCGERKYERWLTLAADGSFTAQDRVSPCPPKVACVWSGIVNYSGTWAAADNALTLTRSDNAKPPNTITLLSALSWADGDDAPSEAHDSAPCAYARHEVTP